MAESDDGASKDLIILREPVAKLGVQSESEISEAVLIASSFSKITLEDLFSRSRRDLFDSALCYLRGQVLNLDLSGPDSQFIDFFYHCTIFVARDIAFMCGIH